MAVGSVLAQTCPDYEMILVNDGSTDQTEKVFAEIKAAHPDRVALVSQSNQGLAMARQAGLDRAFGEYIVFLDSDDRLMPGMLGSCLAGFDRRPGASVIVGRTRVVYENEKSAPRILKPGSNAGWPAILSSNPFGSPCSMMPRKKAVLEAGGVGLPGVRACEDWDLYARMARRGMRFEIVDDVLAEYLQHENALSRDIGLMLRERIALLDRMAKDVAGLPSLAGEVYARYRNGHVLFTIGQAAGRKDNIQYLDRIAGHMVPGKVDFRYFCNQFLYGLQHSVAMKREGLEAEYIEQVCGLLSRRLSAIGSGAEANALAGEFRREMKNPMLRRSIARRLSRMLDPFRRFPK